MIYLSRRSITKLLHVALLSIALVIASGALSPAPHAAEVTTLYDVAVPVAGQGAVERSRAIREAFAEVLVKVSGDRNAPRQPALKAAFSDTMRYVQQYRYHKLVRHDAGSGDVELPALELRISFDPRAVNQLLFDTGNPVWGRARPTTLIWLAVQDQTTRFLVGSDMGQAFQDEIARQAQRRGIPVLFPLMDLEDQAALHFTDVWGNFQDSILAASRRYQSEAVLVGRLYLRQGGEWEARWTLYSDAEPRYWSATASEAGAVLAAGIDSTADSLALRFAQRGGGSANRVTALAVSGVDSLKDFARVLDYLESIDSVTSLQVSRVEADNVVFHLRIRGDESGLRQAIAFGGTLAPESGSGSQDVMGGQPEQVFTYRLLQ